MSFGKVPNQTLFAYIGPIETPLISLPQPHEGSFCNLLEYLSPYVRSFIQRYFNRCQWKGWGLGQYKQGPRYKIKIYYQ